MKRANAFTLVELLVASAVFGVLMLSLYLAFRTGMLGYSNIDEFVTADEGVALVFRRMNLDLRNSFPFSKSVSGWRAASDFMSFYTVVDVYEQEGMVQKYARVTYFLSEKRLMRLCVVDKESLRQQQSESAAEMVSGVKSLVLSYAAPDEARKNIVWKQDWDNQGIVPVAVKVELVLEAGGHVSFERTVFLPISEKLSSS